MTDSGDQLASRPRLPSVRLLIMLAVVIPVALVSVALIIITTITSRSVAEELGQEIVVGTSSQVASDVRNYLASAVRVSDLYTRRITSGELPISNLSAWEQMIFSDLAVNPDVASICFCNSSGDCTWLLRAHNRLELGVVNGSDLDHASEYPADEDGRVDRAHPIRVYHYDARARPWHQLALASSVPAWTPIYFWFGDKGTASETGTGYTRAVRDPQGKLMGVLVVDVTLNALSTHLKSMSVRRDGHAFIIDQNGLLVAASDGPVNSADGKRLSLSESPSAAARAVAVIFSSGNGGGVDHVNPVSATARVDFEGDHARIRAGELTPYYGIDWEVATLLPESTFLHVATVMQQRAIILAGGAIAVGVAIGLYFSRRLSEPLIQLSRHVARVGGGDFDSRLDLNAASELRHLSDEVNRMARGLKHRMQLEHSLAIAQQVQQGLLPVHLPTSDRLEVAACCKYCDATGGDYYDFIEMGSQTIFAVGDVAGHGIGAALLMATGRGAIRTAARAAQSLGEILTQANHVLLANDQYGSFMTLSLLLVDPASKIVRWSSAGHDPTLVFHPDTNSFDELSSGEIPLGVEAEVRYEEYQRACATPGAIFVIGTDGIWESRDQSGEMFGKDRLRNLMRDNSESAELLSQSIKSALYNFVGNSPLSDDVTFVVIKVREK